MRTPMVTRTIKATTVTAMVVDTEKGQVSNMDFTLSRTYKDDKAILKALSKVDLADNLRIVKVISTNVTEEKYGMTETEFIATAKIM